MSYHDADDAIRNMLRRGRVVSLNANDPDHLTGTFFGMKGQQMADVVLSHNFGHYSEPMPGASAVMLRLGGGDSYHAIGFDDPRSRPKNLGAGSTALYDASGNIVSLVQKNIRVVSPQTVAVQAPSFTWNGKTVKTE